MAYIGNTPQYQSFAPAVDYFSGNGVTVTFTLSRPVASVAQLTAVIDNVIQNPSSAFTVAGNAITFTSAPLSGTNNIWVEYTSLVTTYAAISQDPSVIGDITATGGYLAEGDFGNSYIDGTIVDYVTGNARITTGPLDNMTFYHGGTASRSAMMDLYYAGGAKVYGGLIFTGALGVGSSPSYGSAGQVLTSQGSGAAPIWASLPYTFDYLIVAGGGAGGGAPSSGANGAGGGGAGGYVTGSLLAGSGTAYAVTIGAGGTGTTSTGADGVASSLGSLGSAVGGGGGAASLSGNSSGRNGGSGGGGSSYSVGDPGGAGTSGQGNAGGTGASSPNYPGAGGGGAGAVGATASASGNGGAGGAGLNWQSLVTFYAGGGGGGCYSSGSGGAGGTGGGGAGARSANGTAGTANTGGGGGGTGAGPYSGGNGGSGIVIIRYLGPQVGTGGTVTSSGGYTYHTFTTSGTFTS
jgi:hypothetical protein